MDGRMEVARESLGSGAVVSIATLSLSLSRRQKFALAATLDYMHWLRSGSARAVDASRPPLHARQGTASLAYRPCQPRRYLICPTHAADTTPLLLHRRRQTALRSSGVRSGLAFALLAVCFLFRRPCIISDFHRIFITLLCILNSIMF